MFYRRCAHICDLVSTVQIQIFCMMLNALRSRELGSQLRIGDTDRMYRRVYSKFQVHHKWEQQVNSGSIYNLEFSPDG